MKPISRAPKGESIFAADQRTVLRMFRNRKGWIDDANEIVRAVNAHDALVSALQGARTMLADLDAGYPRRELHTTPEAMLTEIDAALAGADATVETA